MNIDLEEFHAAFFEEVSEHLTGLEDGLLQLESRPQDDELIHGIFRAAHSIKGTGGALGFTEVAGFTHHVETVLDQMRQRQLSTTSERIELLLQATDALSSLIDAAKGDCAPPDNLDELVESLRRQIMPEGEVAASVILEATSEALILFDDEPATPLPTVAATPTAGGEPTRAKSANQAESIRVSVAKVEELINLVGELVIANSMVQQAYADESGDAQSLQEAIAAMDLTTQQLQEQVMAVRMMPIANVFRRFPRIVRDLASTLGKNVILETSGEETELDKQVIEEVSDPLTHLIRNAVDHGLETPAQRLAAGKPAEGRIHLRAFHEGGNVVIEIADDGAGINAQRVRQKAIDRGLIAADAVMTDDETNQLIMLPGFSTAEKITDVSGRGVGMDVVKRNVEALNGSISIRSTQGKGSTFRIRLPLTMAILDGLAMRLGNDVYVLPLLSVVESLRPEPKHIVHIAERGELVMVRGEPLPLIYTHRLFNVSGEPTNPCDGLVVIVEHQGRKYGIVVDELIGQLQVVMKSLEANYERVDGVSGATILGDGRIAMIVDIAGLVRLAF
ncbi:MAG: chemotaxis protein CheA [Pirellula sp.]|nr:chemotaxis protein CheA [Pirellula sp.]